MFLFNVNDNKKDMIRIEKYNMKDCKYCIEKIWKGANEQ